MGVSSSETWTKRLTPAAAAASTRLHVPLRSTMSMAFGRWSTGNVLAVVIKPSVPADRRTESLGLLDVADDHVGAERAKTLDLRGIRRRADERPDGAAARDEEIADLAAEYPVEPATRTGPALIAPPPSAPALRG